MNSINHDKFEQRLIDRLQDHEVTPPVDLWQAIEAKVANVPSAPSRRKHSRAVWWFAAATAAAACVALYLTLWQPQQEIQPVQPATVAQAPRQPEQKTTAQQHEQPSQPATVAQAPEQPKQETAAQQQQPQQLQLAQRHIKETKSTAPRLTASTHAPATVPAVTEPHDTAVATTAVVDPAENTAILAQETSTSKGTTVVEAKQRQAPMGLELAEEIITPSARWSATIYASGSTVSGTNVDYTYKGFSPHPTFMAPASSGEVVYGEPRRKVLHCKVPIHVGALARYHITPRWSVEAGIAFTHQEATITTTLNDVVENYEQTMRYVGVPVGVSYTIFNKERFKLYAAARGSVEKCVQSSTTRPYTSTDNPMLYSMSLAPGMQVNITRNLGIFLEPSLSYNISGKSVMPTRYDDMPWDFDLRMGITWTINPKK
ncbi:MAG: outer membrane beta-barrel protein [Muribaculaceae bacterium]|nr:outer membrane beta-barrel protein [Muribaculaceae bacterium]